MAVIYFTTNLINFKYYVGFDYYNDPKYLGSGKLLKKAFKKYGKKHFKKEILEEFIFDVGHPELDDISIGNWKDRERYWIFFYCSFINRELGYNLTEGGEGCIGYKFTKEQCRKLKEILNTPETKHKMVQSALNKPNVTDETKYNMSVAHIGLKDSPDVIEIKTLAQNRKEVKEKHRKNTTNLWKNPEYHKKQVVAQTGKRRSEKNSKTSKQKSHIILGTKKENKEGKIKIK